MKSLYAIGLLILFGLSGSIPGRAQDLANLGQQKPLTLSGGLSVRSIFYQAHGIENRRKPFSYVVAGAPVLSVYGVSIPISFVFSEQERNFRQPFNQFGLSPTYKWITVHAGYRNITFSPYTMAGHTFLGGGVELNPGLLRFGFLYGRFNRATAIDTTSGSLEPFSYTRKGYAVKLGVGTRKNFLDFSLVKAKDDSTSAQPDLLSRRRVTPAENVVLGISAKLSFLKSFYWEGEGGLSIYTRNISSSLRLDSVQLLPNGLENTLGNLIDLNGSSEFYSAYQTALGYRDRKFGLRLQYRRVDPGYQSMGAYFFNNDVENITITPSAVLFKQRLRLVGSLGIQRDNLQNQKQATSRRIIGSANVSADFTERLGVDLTFSNFSTNQRARTILLADSFLIAQTTKNISITPHYYLTDGNLNHVFLFSFNRMTLKDQNDRTADLSNIESDNMFFNYQLSFAQTGLMLSLNLNSTLVKLASGNNGNQGVTVGLSKRFWSNKLLLGLTSAYLKGTRGDGKSTILNQGIRADWQASRQHRFNVLMNFIGNYPDQLSDTPTNPRFQEFRGELGYTFNF